MKSVFEKSYLLNQQVGNKLTFLTEKTEAEYKRRNMQQESFDLSVRSRLWTPSVPDIQTIHLEDVYTQHDRNTLNRTKSAKAQLSHTMPMTGARKTVSALAKHNKNDNTSKEKVVADKKTFLAWSNNKLRLLSEKQAASLTSKGQKLLSITQISQENDVVNDEYVHEGKLEQRRVRLKQIFRFPFEI